MAENKAQQEFSNAELLGIVKKQQEALDALSAQVYSQAAAMGMAEIAPLSIDPKDHPNYIEHGSRKHAALLGIVQVGKQKQPDGVHVADGYKLVDGTMFGAHARPEFLAEVLRQKVSELKTKQPKRQSVDPRKPNYAKALWTPDDSPEWSVTRVQ